MSRPQHFFQWLKKETIQSPQPNVDQAILAMVKPQEKSSSHWLILSATVMASVMILVTTKNLNSINQQPISESPELLKYYDQIELMADSSNISDEDWKNLTEGKK